MKIVKISSLGCPSCIIMNKVVNEIKKEYDKINFVELDYDFDEDEVKKYNPGKKLPVFIFYKNDIEINRLCGEHKKEEFVNIIEGN